MKAYYFDQNGLFVKVREVEQLPENATDKKPPETWPPEIPCWNGSDWEITKDYRGQTMYKKETKEAVIITEVGDIDPAYTLIESADPEYDEWDEASQSWITNTAQKQADEQAQQEAEKRQKILEGLPQILTEWANDDLADAMILKTKIKNLLQSV